MKQTELSQVCVLDNKDVLMDEFQPEVRRQIEAKNIPTKVYAGVRPPDCSHYMEYTANWSWDMAMYLTYAEFRIYDNVGPAGRAVYDARHGGGRLDKFGPTADKIRPLVDQLFGSVSVGPPPVPVPAKATRPEPTSDRNVRLQELKMLHEQGLINDDELAAKKREILDEI